MITMDEFLTVKEVATELRVSEETVKRMLRRKELPGRKVSNVWRIPVDRYKEWKNQQSDLSEGPALES